MPKAKQVDTKNNNKEYYILLLRFMVNNVEKLSTESLLFTAFSTIY
jgi:hypothetical protein